MRDRLSGLVALRFPLALVFAIAPFVSAIDIAFAEQTKDPGDHRAPTHGDVQSVDSSVDESSGKARYTIPIDVPPGPGGHQPALSLNYGGTTVNGIYGIGWSLPMGEVKCSSRFGVPSSQSECERFELNGQLLVEDLNSPAAYREFRTVVESFQRIRLHVSGAYAGTWESVTPDGMVSRYGVGHSAFSPSQTLTDEGPYPAKTVIWKITSQTDPFGNQILYTYATLGDPGSLYPLSISYAEGTRSVEFAYESRPDPIRDFRGGVLTEINYRGTDIVVRSNGEVLSRQAIRYEPIPGSGEVVYDVTRSRIRGVTRSGLESAPGVPLAVMPEVTFEYSRNELPTSDYSQWSNVSAAGRWQDETGAPTDGPAMGEIKFADVNGDGKQDAVVAVCPVEFRPCGPSATGVWQVWIKGDGVWRLDPAWSSALSQLTFEIPTLSVQYTSLTASDMESDQSQQVGWELGVDGYSGLSHPSCAATDGVATERIYFSETQHRYHSNDDPNTFLPAVNWYMVDLDGDGLSDLIASARVGGLWLTHDCSGGTVVRRPTPLYVEGKTVRTVFLNDGQSWALAPSSYASGLPDFSRTFVSSELSFSWADINIWHDDTAGTHWAVPDGGWWTAPVASNIVNAESPCPKLGGLQQTGQAFNGASGFRVG